MEELTQEDIIFIKNLRLKYDYEKQIKQIEVERDVLTTPLDNDKETILTEKNTEIEDIQKLIDGINI